MKLTINEVVKAVKGQLLDGNEADVILGISTDSRSIGEEEMFVPLIGDKFNGHDYIKMVREKGAKVAFWQANQPIPSGLNVSLIVVDDTLVALQDLALYYRRKINPLVVGVTGSNGKTTTKDLLASILKTKYKIHKTKGNLNNHIGVPLTILSMAEDVEVAIIEMGMSNLGEIEVLSKIAQPDIALITNIGESHLEFLRTRENIAKAKLEILSGMNAGGWAILLGDETLLKNGIERLSNRPNIIWVGKGIENDYYSTEVTTTETGQILFHDNMGESYQISLLGIHNVVNTLMAIRVGQLLKLSINDIKSGLSDIELTGMRMEKMVAKSGAVILNDAYNASPTSMKASLELLGELEEYTKKIVVLGDMLELGEMTEYYHREIGGICANLVMDKLIATGNLGKWIADGALEAGMDNSKIFYTENKDDIIKCLRDIADPNTVILIKGSRGVRLEKVVNELL